MTALKKVVRMMEDAPPHILDARLIAEGLNKMRPELAMEKFEEIKRHWKELREQDHEKIDGI